MSSKHYSLSDRIWCFIGVTLVCAITSAMVTLAISAVIVYTAADGIPFIRPLFLTLFLTMIALQILAPKVMEKILTGSWHFVAGLIGGWR